MSKSVSARRLPVWAGIMAVLTASYCVNFFVIPLIHPALASIPEHGVLPFLTTTAGLVGIWYALTGKDEQAQVCSGVCTGLGLFGTATGLAIMSAAKGAGQYEGLSMSFLSTAHGILMLVLIEFLLMWRMPGDQDNGSGRGN